MKHKKCKICGNTFTPQRPIQGTCSIECAIKHARNLEAKKTDKKVKEMKKGLLTHKDYLKALQVKINTIVRNIDTHFNCISSNRNTGQFHAGHFHTTQGKPALRFHLFNIWKQSAQDNTYKSGNIQDYIMNLNINFGSEWVHENIINLPYKYPVLKLSVPDLQDKISIANEVILEQKKGQHIALSNDQRIIIRENLQKRFGIYK